MILKYLSLHFSEDCYSKKKSYVDHFGRWTFKQQIFFYVQQALIFVPTLEVMDD